MSLGLKKPSFGHIQNELFNSSEDYDTNRLNEKEQEISYKREKVITNAKVINALKSQAKFAVRKSVLGVVSAASFFEPEILKRTRSTRIHNEKIGKIEIEQSELVKDRKLHKDIFQNNKTKRDIVEDLNRWKLAEKKIASKNALELKKRIKLEEREVRIASFDKRHKENIKNKRYEQEEKRRAKFLDENKNEKERRIILLNQWKEQKDELQEEARRLKKKAKAHFDDSQFPPKEAFTHHSQHTQIKTACSSTEVCDDINIASKVDNEDDIQVCLFSPPIPKQSERVRTELYNLQKQCGTAKMRHSYLFEERKKIMENLKLLDSRRSRTLINLSQIDTGIAFHLSCMKNPIRREATTDERRAMHLLKTKKNEIQSSLKELNRNREKLEKILPQYSQQIESSSKTLHDLKKKMESTKINIKSIENDLSDVPFVVGRNISDEFDPVLARPLESMNIITQRSKLEITRDGVKKGLEIHKAAMLHENEIWNSRLEWLNEISEFELLKTKLNAVKDRLKVFKNSNKKSDINQAIKLFWHSGTKLIPVKHDFTSKVRVVQEGINVNKKHILSDFVKKLRVEEQNGSLRLMNLLSELEASRECKGDWWDSGVLFGVAKRPLSNSIDQSRLPHFGPKVTVTHRMISSSAGGAKCFKRYRRSIFIKILEKEIENIKKNVKPSKSQQLPDRVDKSQQAYFKKKQSRYLNEINDATSLTSHMIEVLDAPNQGKYIIKSCKIKWVENCTKPLIEHVVQKCNDSWESNGYELAIDLSQERYFIHRNKNLKLSRSVPVLSEPVPSIPCFGKALMNASSYEDLVKERCELEEQNVYFYDFDVTPGVYDIKLRHGSSYEALETTGVVESPLQLKRKKMVANCLAYRREDEKHKANFQDILDRMGRINGFRLRISQLHDANKKLIPRRMDILNSLAFRRSRLVDAEDRICEIISESNEIERRLDEELKANINVGKAMTSLTRAELSLRDISTRSKKIEYDVRVSKSNMKQIQDVIQSTLNSERRSKFLMRKFREKREIAQEIVEQIQRQVALSEEKVLKLLFRKRGHYVPTRYGPRKLFYLREKDRMLCVHFPLGNSSGGTRARLNARLYFTLNEAIEIDARSSKSNLKEMAFEDKLSRHLYHQEEKDRRLEVAKMGDEDRCSQIFLQETIHLCKAEDIRQYHQTKAIKCARDAMKRSFHRKEIEIRKQKTKKKFKAMHIQNNQRESKFGNHSSIVRNWNRISTLRKMCKQEKQIYFKELVAADTVELNRALFEEERSDLCSQISALLTDEIVRSIILEEFQELKKENENQIHIAEKESNIVFPEYQFLSYSLYCELRDLKMDQLRTWKEKLFIWSLRDGKNYSVELKGKRNLQHLEKDLELRKKKESEDKIIKQHCREMYLEDCKCKHFYHREMLEVLHERRNMMHEEHRIKMFLKEKEFERENALSKYNVLKLPHKTEKASENMKRRSELKRDAAQRKKNQKEMRSMYKEDMIMRSHIAFEKRDEQQNYLSVERKLFHFFSFEEANLESRQNVENELQKIKSDDEALERRKQKEWKDKIEKAHADLLAKKVLLLEREGDAKLFEKELNRRKNEQESLSEKLRVAVKEEIRKERIYNFTSRKLLSFQAALEGSKIMKSRCKSDLIQKQRVSIQTKAKAQWMDTYVLHKVHQRLNTKKLNKILHKKFFEEMVSYIICKAEFVATQRKSDELSIKMSQIKNTLKDKNLGMKRLWRKFRRHDHFMMYRSQLGRKMFVKSRTNTLTKALHGWKLFTRWHMSRKNAYRLQYSLMKKDIDFNNLNSDTQEKIVKQKENLRSFSSTNRTYFDRIKDRVIQCRTCDAFYTENINHSHACYFHPGKYIVPMASSTQKNAFPENVNTLNSNKRSWSCCGNYEEYSAGCRTQYHVPPYKGDISFAQNHTKLLAKDCLNLIKKNKKITKYNAEMPEVFRTKKKEILQIQKSIERRRTLATKYDTNY